MQRIVINNCYGGFGLSHKAIFRLAELKGIKLYAWADETSKRIYGTDDVNVLAEEGAIGLHYTTVPKEEYDKLRIEDEKKKDYKSSNKTYYTYYDIERDDKDLIKVIEEMGEKANGRCANLNIVEIPDDVEWEIEEYDGNEWISEKHRTWR